MYNENIAEEMYSSGFKQNKMIETTLVLNHATKWSSVFQAHHTVSHWLCGRHFLQNVHCLRVVW